MLYIELQVDHTFFIHPGYCILKACSYGQKLSLLARKRSRLSRIIFVLFIWKMFSRLQGEVLPTKIFLFGTTSSPPVTKYLLATKYDLIVHYLLSHFVTFAILCRSEKVFGKHTIENVLGLAQAIHSELLPSVYFRPNKCSIIFYFSSTST